MRRFSMLLQITANMGLRYVCYRVLHLIKTKVGWYVLVFPTIMKPKIFISYSQWLQQKKEYFLDNRRGNQIDSLLTDEEKRKISESASKIKNGIFLFFNSQEFSLGVNYNWMTNPLNGYTYPSNQHWSKINDYNDQSGDIKFVWEKSRFSFLYSLIRDEEINGSKHREFILSQISEWIDTNPVNQGPNWKCSQEISIRVLNWIFAIYYYSDKGVIDEQLWQKILNSIYQQMCHVRGHINFSRIAVRNNHAITECLTLYIVGLLFPWMDQDCEWKKKGKKWFEQEVSCQIYPDGTFLQFSMNYHRVVIQLLAKAIIIAELNDESFDNIVYERAHCSVNFLYQCQSLENGHLPNYGANDGALFFPLNSCNYRDFRPQLNALHYVLTGIHLYPNGAWIEDTKWLTGNIRLRSRSLPPLKKQYGLIHFDKGGYYLIRDANGLTFFRAGSHKDRPSQADNLHIDLWEGAENILIDGGSYKYNDRDKEMVRYFIGTKSHNTVMLGDHDQMLKGGRFVWFYWTQLEDIKFEDNESYYLIDATISAFRHLDKNCKHRRIIKKQKNRSVWIIEDFIYSNTNHPLQQIWHIMPQNKDRLILAPDVPDEGSLSKKETKAWYSPLYGLKESSEQIVFSTNTKHLRTNISIKNQ